MKNAGWIDSLLLLLFNCVNDSIYYDAAWCDPLVFVHLSSRNSRRYLPTSN